MNQTDRANGEIYTKFIAIRVVDVRTILLGAGCFNGEIYDALAAAKNATRWLFEAERDTHTHTHVHEHADASDYAEITLWTVRQLYIRFKRWLLLLRSLFYVCMMTTKQTAKCEREMRSPIAVHESKTFEFNYTTSIFASLFFSQSIH